MGTITSANSSFQLSAAGVFSTPQTLQGYAADDAFTTEAADIAETVLGVDGILNFGWIPFMVDMSIMIMPNSLSSTLFDQIVAAEAQNREKVILSATIQLPSIGQKYNLGNGTLKKYPPVPSARKVLQARTFGLVWGRISAGPMS